jgi:integrase
MAATALPSLPHFGDHLTPAILLSVNTGLRRGELLALCWDCIDFNGRTLTVEGGTAKSRKTRHVFLNEEATRALTQWREHTQGDRRVFDISTGFKKAWAPLLKRAAITKFRWHDLRHHFASRLVQAGVPLNTVRYLLGHSSVAMSLRYAHLAPKGGLDAISQNRRLSRRTASIIESQPSQNPRRMFFHACGASRRLFRPGKMQQITLLPSRGERTEGFCQSRIII